MPEKPVAHETTAQRATRRGFDSADPEDPRHGTLYAYGSLGCRCRRCRDTRLRYMSEWRVRSRHKLVRGDHRHGTLNGYTNFGCRCDLCTIAMRVAGELLELRRKRELKA